MTSRKADDVSAMDDTPHIFFVMWDDDKDAHPRCRIWCVRPDKDAAFRAMCSKWYKQRAAGEIKSNNFQLHPPRFRDDNIIRNMCGNLSYPLLFCAIRKTTGFELVHYDADVLEHGKCKRA